MSDEEHGRILAEKLKELVKDIEPSQSLLARVERDLDDARDAALIGRARRLRGRITAVALPALAAIAAIIVLLSNSGVTPSFAVTTDSDGAILVTIRELAGVTGANARLGALGVPVTVVPIRPGCHVNVQMSYIGIGSDYAATARVVPGQIPPNTTVILGARQVSSSRIEMAVGRVSGAAPACVAPGNSGPGIPGATSPTQTTTVRSTSTRSS